MPNVVQFGRVVTIGEGLFHAACEVSAFIHGLQLVYPNPNSHHVALYECTIYLDGHVDCHSHEIELDSCGIAISPAAYLFYITANPGGSMLDLLQCLFMYRTGTLTIHSNVINIADPNDWYSRYVKPPTCTPPWWSALQAGNPNISPNSPSPIPAPQKGVDNSQKRGLDLLKALW